MEGLFELVAASFVRHGIESPTGDPEADPRIRVAEPDPTSLPDHSYRKKPDTDLST